MGKLPPTDVYRKTPSAFPWPSADYGNEQHHHHQQQQQQRQQQLLRWRFLGLDAYDISQVSVPAPLVVSRPHRVGVPHRPSLPGTRLPVGQYGRVEAVHAALDQGQGGEAVNLFLRRPHPKHVVEPKTAAVVSGNHLFIISTAAEGGGGDDGGQGRRKVKQNVREKIALRVCAFKKQDVIFFCVTQRQ